MSKVNLYELAKKVIEESNELTQVWIKLDYFAENGHFPDEGEAKVMDVNDMSISDIVTKLLTLPSYISKSKKKVASMPDGVQKDLLKADIKAKEIELNAIKALRHDKTI